MTDFDKRIDALEKALSLANARIDELARPWYKTNGFKASSACFLILAATWGYSFLNKDPEIPRMLHQNVLMSDQALALIMQREISNLDKEGPLEKQLGRSVESYFVLDDTQAKLSDIAMDAVVSAPSKRMMSDIAANQAARTYSEARIYRKQELNIGSVRCQLISDPELWTYLSSIRLENGATSSNAPSIPSFGNERRLRAGCEGNGKIAAQTTVPFYNISPVVIPYIANAGDRVELEIHVLANSYDAQGHPTRSTIGHKLIEAFHERPNSQESNASIEFEEVVTNNVLRAEFNAPEGAASNLVFVELNEDGQSKLDSDSEGSLIVVFATVTVFPSNQLGE